MPSFIRKIYSDESIKVSTFLFVILQPVIDVLTGWTNHLPISFGIIVKVLFVGYMLFYLIFVSRKPLVIAYILITLVFVIISLGLSVSNYGLSFGFSNLIEIFKTFFFTYSLIWLYLLYNERRFVVRWNDMVFIFTCIFIIFLISLITKSDYKSYSWSEATSGWFFSANEISAILAALFPIAYISIIKSKRIWYKFAMASVIVFFSVIVGTRSVFYAAVGLYFCILIYQLISLMFQRNKKVLINILIVIFSLAVTTYVYPLSPASGNTSSNPVVVTPGNGSGNNQGGNQGNNEDPGFIDEIKDEIINMGGALLGDKSSLIIVGLNSILKNRLIYWVETQRIYNESDTVNRVLGIGSFIDDNGKRKQIQVEMDFVTIFYRYGFVGFALYMIPLLVLAFAIFIKMIKEPKIILSFEFLSFCYSISLILGLSFLAGHVLIAPSVSIYVAIFGINLLDYEEQFSLKKKVKRKVVFISSAGGHLTQLLKLQDLFSEFDSVVITEDIPINHSLKPNATVRFLPYGSRAEKGYLKVFVRMWAKSIFYFIIDRPEIVVTTGTHTAVPLSIIAKVFNRKLLYIESFAKRTSPNLAGRILYPFADVMVVQWDSMLNVYKKSKNWGWIY